MTVAAVRRLDRAGGGLWVDLAFYLLSAAFAGWTAAASTLAPHRAWGALTVGGYVVAAVATGILFLHRLPRPRWRARIAVGAWALTCLLPLVVEAIQRASGRTDRAQEEVIVVEQAGQRLLEHGTPYLGRGQISALAQPLLGYVPYQPAMAVFGLPRALDPAAAWWSDARIWFALATIAALFVMRRGLRDAAGVRALQAVTVFPVAALTLATGGDDLPVLVLCLLALWLAASERYGWSGVAIGAACALKLFAWPVAVVLAALALRRRRFVWLWGTLGIPIVTAIPPLVRDPGALVENVIAYPFGRGVVTSPAASPLPGHLIAQRSPALATALLALAVVAVLAYVVVRPPATAARAALISGLALLAAMLLLPSSRFGYLLYPAALLLWVPALGRSIDPPGAKRAGRVHMKAVTYTDRRAAGDELARLLSAYRERPDAIVLGLVRGGVPVAERVAAQLRLPLDVLVVRKLGVPWAPEVAFGALGPGGVVVHNVDMEHQISGAEVNAVIAEEQEEVVRREALYRAGREPLDLHDRTAIIVDDGLATGATARAAVRVARKLEASRVILAVPVAPPEAVDVLSREADEVVCPLIPPTFGAVSRFYESFPQTSDAEVAALLDHDTV